MKKIYTCSVCSFPFAVEEEAVPELCPSCNSSKDNYLVEPWNGSIEARRIHVDFPKPDPNWDPMNISYHHPKQFPAHTRHGRVRRFVLPYDNDKLEQTRTFYKEAMDWDMYDTEHSDPAHPLIFCATGPGNANWEPKYPSFGYGYLRARSDDETGADPRFIVEVDNIEDTLKKVVEFGGKVLKERFSIEDNDYAVVQDGEGNAMYIWETPSTVTWDEPESQNISFRN